MFTLKQILYSVKDECEICFIATNKTNYREFIHFENENTNIEDYTSSVSYGKKIKINLKLNKSFLNELEHNVKYDVKMKLIESDENAGKLIYKISRISLSILDDEPISTDQYLLDSNEIMNLHSELYKDVSNLVERLELILKKINNLDKPSLYNINELTSMKNDLTLFFEKNNI